MTTDIARDSKKRKATDRASPKGHAVVRKRRLRLDGCLPDELLMRIFQMMGPVAVGRTASLVCRRWAEVASDQELWRRFARTTITTARPRPDVDYRRLVIKHLVTRDVEERDLAARLQRIDERTLASKRRAVLREHSRRAQAAIMNEHDAQLRDIVQRCVPALPYEMRIQLLCLAVYKNSHRCLDLLQEWHRCRSIAEGVQSCPLAEEMPAMPAPADECEREADESDVEGCEEVQELPTLRPAVYMASSNGQRESLQRIIAFHKNRCRCKGASVDRMAVCK
ncbi:F-box domain-containing protein [Acanthamoeba castellanii medusavirus]|uniref:F-box domain-containing protein n=1 Tax=Acanthamoeba castellanii medusavirus J1 TaxID=3114988 RepID=A0A3T1CWN3_9VIRU|nr:F-box domain-containing protein [Acanthamoeba castellanii medusavirus]BBI30219.1 F-box domain-containing protein [Acanthamoeba castellanii medusavirus J1]